MICDAGFAGFGDIQAMPALAGDSTRDPMKLIYKAIASLALLAALHPAYAAPVDCGAGRQKVEHQGFVSIGGIEQWLTVKGDDCHNPVILFVHGGPGNPMTPYADAVYRGWEKDFTMVHWDQRGAGVTYGRNPVAKPEEAGQVLTIARLAADGAEVAAWVSQYLGKKKLILFGGSWGSALAVHMAKARPELFAAYVGTGQMVNHGDNQRASYARVLELARAAGDGKTVAAIEALGAPPWSDPRAMGIVRRATRIYEAKATDQAPQQWWVRAPFYATPQMLADYEGGEEFSWIQFVGMKGKGMLSTIDLPKLGVDFAMPVFMLQGEEDLVTLPAVAKAYFDSIRAPQKAWFPLARTGHDPNPAMIAAQYQVLRTRAAPLAQ